MPPTLQAHLYQRINVGLSDWPLICRLHKPGIVKGRIAATLVVTQQGPKPVSSEPLVKVIGVLAPDRPGQDAARLEYLRTDNASLICDRQRIV